MTESELTAREIKARSKRYKRPLCLSLNWHTIMEDVYQIQSECTDAQYMSEDDSELIEAYGDEQAMEYRIAFAGLSSDCDRFIGFMDEYRALSFQVSGEWWEDLFDLFFPAVSYVDSYGGYDEVEQDYMPIDGYEIEAAQKEAKKKLLRMTKEQLIDLAHLSMETVRQYLSIKYRFDSLADAMEILKAKNGGMLQMVKAIEDAYEEAREKTMDFKYEFSTRLDMLVYGLPDETWLI